MSSELRIKSVKSISWNLFEKMGMFGLKFVLGIILARLLTPEDYGLIGLISIFFAISTVLINSGFGMAYIRQERVTKEDANTVFFVNLTISIIIYIVLWLLAPAISRFYEQPILVELTRVLGLIVIISAFRIIQDSQISRDLNFKKRAKIVIFSTLISGLTGITAAYYGFGVWSLVLQQLLNAFIITLSLAITNSWKPSFSFSNNSLRNMFNFGGWVVLNGLMREFFMHVYVMIIGKVFPIAQAGFYKKAKEIERMISTRISTAVVEISFPVLSKNQNDINKTKNTFRKFLIFTMLIIVPLLTVLIVTSDSFVLLLLKEKWKPIIPFLRLFAVIGILFPVNSMNNQLMYALGKSKLNFSIGLITNFLRILNILIMIRFGVIFIIFGEVILSFINFSIYVFFTNRYIKYGLLSQLNDLKWVFAGALLSGITGYSLHFFTDNNYLLLFGGAFIVFSFYMAFQILANKNQTKELKNLLWSLIQNKSNK